MILLLSTLGFVLTCIFMVAGTLSVKMLEKIRILAKLKEISFYVRKAVVL